MRDTSRLAVAALAGWALLCLGCSKAVDTTPPAPGSGDVVQAQPAAPGSAGPSGQAAGPAASASSVGAKGDEPLINAVNAYTLGYNLLWSQILPVHPSVTQLEGHVLGELVVLIQSPTNVVTALDAKNGDLKWSRILGGVQERLLAATRREQQVLINSESSLYVLDADSGRVISKQRLYEVVNSGPAIVSDYAVFGGVEGTLYAHDLVSGDAAWQYKTKSGIFTSPVSAGSNQVFVADNSGYYALFDVLRRERLWQGRAWGAVVGQPLVTNVGILIPSVDHNLYAINRTDGLDRVGWPYRTEAPLRGSPTLIGKFLFQVVPGRGLVVIDAAKKEDLWTTDASAVPLLINRKGLVVFGGDRLQVVDPANGQRLNEVAVRPLHRVLLGPKGSLILLSRAGRLLRLDPA